MNRMVLDIRYAMRGLLKTPVFTIGVVLTLALGIGINATMFGVVDALFLRTPPAVQDPAGIVRVYYKQNGRRDGDLHRVRRQRSRYVDLADACRRSRKATAVTTGTVSPRARRATRLR